MRTKLTLVGKAQFTGEVGPFHFTSGQCVLDRELNALETSRVRRINALRDFHIQVMTVDEPTRRADTRKKRKALRDA